MGKCNGTEGHKISAVERAGNPLPDFKAETKMLVSLRHPNIVLFMGACFDKTNLAIITEWMPKGSLHSVLHDPREKLDFSIRMRMLRDIACGMGTSPCRPSRAVKDAGGDAANHPERTYTAPPTNVSQRSCTQPTRRFCIATLRAPTSSWTRTCGSRCPTLA